MGNFFGYLRGKIVANRKINALTIVNKTRYDKVPVPITRTYTKAEVKKNNARWRKVKRSKGADVDPRLHHPNHGPNCLIEEDPQEQK